MTFIGWLQDAHADLYTGLDDNMSDDFDQWLGYLDNQELIDHAEDYGIYLTSQYQ